MHANSGRQVIDDIKPVISQLTSQELDECLAAFRSTLAAGLRPARGWLRAARQALGLQQGMIARKIGVTRQSYAELETAEEREAISLKSLKRAADAMDCELVYFLVPQESVAKTFEALARRHDPKPKNAVASAGALGMDDEIDGDPGPKLSER